jgi:hypothetical protein
VLVLPLGDLHRDLGAVLHAVTGGWRTVNGFSGYEPGYYEALRTLSDAEDEILLAPLVARSDLHVLVDQDARGMRAMLERQPGGELAATSGRLAQYRLPRRPVSRPEAPPLGRRLGPASLTASCTSDEVGRAIDGDLQTSWVCGPQVADHEMAIDLGGVVPTGAIAYALGPAAAGFPRHLIVETSVDGAVWEAAWEGSPAAAVLFAAMEAPRETRVVHPFTPRPARYVRLRQVGRHESSYWSMAEVEVWTGVT